MSVAVGIDKALVGTDKNDVIFGTTDSDTIFGGAGHDAIFGQAGNDILNGDDGNDLLQGGDGNDKIDGGNGSNVIFGGNGHDILVARNDVDSGTNFIFGGSGNDYINGSSNDDYLYGENGNDELFGWFGNDTINGGAGNDRIQGAFHHSRTDEIDVMTGCRGADTFVLGGRSYGEMQPLYRGDNRNYGLITDFNKNEDAIELNKWEGDLRHDRAIEVRYSLGAAPVGLPQGTGIYVNSPGQSPDLIAILQGVDPNSLNLKASYFKIVD
ncbi:MAG: hypothetical protein CLLPBCKN_003105 [Chroococcidiopsis cubana SAG 39.79]|jgi:Ca2+-binding RTX toxin-like protein|uniref:Hemolysin-type calcium-binding region n=2 Tax=Chroococcidiopsis TaxID=54298 RepID=K9TVN5_CHRTP|nr:MULTISPECIES: calcium-binding protein [Chroococcidiopsis]PSB47167.1 calcium-binding protein [Cyanosarcina cf. burmensis CCALA 770]AFY86453.1 Hemolysin-type calcium-binding region [Chroococcidiopsis thermalis PCC 7203]MDZ4873709.1 hypothetical protein [Chroococcidiopsis cubana SAG 39.79]PSB58186.1 calcium-binding protein [Chroococcidiopsis cubana CCALA 043]PSM49765.1 calcium-binding protein [Chroococcidiopsis sp. CCALA 051]